MIDRTTVRLPEALLSRAKRKAAAEGRTLTALIEEGLRLVVAENRKTKPAKRIMPRVSKASGGLLSGVDLRELEEAEDLEYIARMRRLK
jgi:hypothetical protein